MKPPSWHLHTMTVEPWHHASVGGRASIVLMPVYVLVLLVSFAWRRDSHPDRFWVETRGILNTSV
ncbi:hypothetical protein EMIT0196P_10591 [Pseudomonas chlororaphis]